ncbi:MAG: hypothetical protein KDA84_29280, partial [Planctomycetaceae bacterium]|nr:hypothetical protein [Planctomycetaceae bacterium]
LFFMGIVKAVGLPSAYPGRSHQPAKTSPPQTSPPRTTPPKRAANPPATKHPRHPSPATNPPAATATPRANPPSPQKAPASQASPGPTNPAPVAEAVSPPVASSRNLQSEIDQIPSGGTLQLDEGLQYVAGPVVIGKPMTLIGGGMVIWAADEPVVTINTGPVSLSDLRIELTDSKPGQHPSTGVALQIESDSDVTYRDVAIRGATQGVKEEKGPWRYPAKLELGLLEGNRPYEFRLRIVTGTDCKLQSEVAGIAFDPQHVSEGASEVLLKIPPLKEDTRIRGQLVIKTKQLDRVIDLTGRMSNSPNASGLKTGEILFEPSDWSTVSVTPSPEEPEPESPSTPSSPVSPTDPEPESSSPPPSPVPPTVSESEPSSSDEISSKSKRRSIRPGKMSGLFGEQDSN